MTSRIAPRSFPRTAVAAVAAVVLFASTLAAANPTAAAAPECSTSGGVTVCMGEIIIISRVP